ncbi:3-methyl-2-oxobutanoate hydroxymethyltransferase [[Candida] anglica]|uniref:3-methyl-2-oxobutanoate hydroxymethyltransferase n=1 Tax=[Candida] anglica TaxID=148631 RepID=A0ABP0EB80_9ASCO
MMLVSRRIGLLERVALPSKFIRTIHLTSSRSSSYSVPHSTTGPKIAPRKTLLDISELYNSKTPISVVTAHDYITSKYAEAAGIDITLVGDSLAMTALGYSDTNEIPFDEFLYHVKAVNRGNKSSFLVADLPFGSFERSSEQAVSTAIELIKTGRMHAVKIECGKDQLESVRKIVDVGIPVMGHVGLTPQRHNALGGFKLQGNSTKRALEIYQECLDLQRNGVFSIVLECIPNRLAEFITNNLSIPTIGIGAGPHCSGQVLVAADILGMNNPDAHKAKFVKQYGSQYNDSVKSYNEFTSDLQSKAFPLENEHGYKMKKDVFEQFKLEAVKLK